MKRLIIHLIAVAALGSLVARGQAIALAGQWRFQLDRADAGITEQWFAHTLSGTFRLPGSLPEQRIGDVITTNTPWTGSIFDRSWFTAPEYARYRQPGNIKIPFWLQPEKYYKGAAWFQRDVKIPKDWNGKRVVLSLERPHWETRVWLDGSLIGTNASLSTPHEYDLGELQPGAHTLTIRVDNRMIVEIGENSHAISDHTQGNWNGIVGDISLRATPLVWIEDLQVYPHVATKSITLKGKIGNASGRSGNGKLRLLSNGRKQEFAVAWETNGGAFEASLVLGAEAKTWDEFSPGLCHLEAVLDGGDHRSVTFGLREVSTEGPQFTINGRKTFFRGTLECCVFPKTGHPPTDVREWKHVIGVAKSYGLNLIRFHSYCPPEAAFEAADELGLYLQVETCWANQSTTMQSGLDEMRRTLRETEPPPPSTMITSLRKTELTATTGHRHAEPPKLISLIKGDLDWIVMKALEKDRTRRYETANGLAMDIQRYLESEPVIARPPSQIYRLQKLVRRNKLVFVAGGVVALTLFFGLGMSTWLFIREREARQQEFRLRAEAEDRAKITQAVMYVSQGRNDDADGLLEQINVRSTQPTLDGVSAFRSVGEWLALQSRWKPAADRYLALIEIDKFDDWRVVTLDYQATGVVLAESGDAESYACFCQKAIANFTSPNADVSGRILKTCLLFPVEKKQLEELRQMAEIAEKYFSSMPADKLPGWAAIHLSLWKYRCGEFAGARDWCQRELDKKVGPPACDAAIHAILSMACQQLDRPGEAHSELAQARKLIHAKFSGGLDRGNGGSGYWYDWLLARVLQREAAANIESSGWLEDSPQ